MNLRIAKKIIKNLENPKLNMRGEQKLKHSKHQIEKAKVIVARHERNVKRKRQDATTASEAKK